MGKKSKLQKYIESEEFKVQNECVISLLCTKLKIIDAQLSMECNRPVVQNINSRIKSYESLVGKLKRKKLSGEIPVVLEKINDLAGVRVVCTYTDDLYRIVDMLSTQKDVNVLKKKDYIQNPKATGYRSIHLILELKLQFQHEEKKAKVELQLRTSAMDYWAGLDYQLQYKKAYLNDAGDKTAEEIRKELKQYASVIREIDKKVLELRTRIEEI